MDARYPGQRFRRSAEAAYPREQEPRFPEGWEPKFQERLQPRLAERGQLPAAERCRAIGYLRPMGWLRRRGTCGVSELYVAARRTASPTVFPARSSWLQRTPSGGKGRFL